MNGSLSVGSTLICKVERWISPRRRRGEEGVRRVISFHSVLFWPLSRTVLLRVGSSSLVNLYVPTAVYGRCPNQSGCDIGDNVEAVAG